MAYSVLFLLLLATPLPGALVWEQQAGFKHARLNVPATGRTGFEKLPALQLGIRFTNQISLTRSILNRNLLNGSGVAAGDLDGDGWSDFYICGINSENILYRNLGNWQFEDVTKSAGLKFPPQDSTGAVFADVDGDGDLDLLATALGHGVRLFQNDGRGVFQEITSQSGLTSDAGSMSMALGDLDGDGDLDLYVANYRSDTIADHPSTTFRVQTVQGRPVVAQVNGEPVTSRRWTNRFEVSPTGQVLEVGEPDFLYLNDGGGKFRLASFTDGTFLDEAGRPLTEAPRDWGLAVQIHDFTADGLPDIYVCNDYFSPDRIWVNQGGGRFKAIAPTAIRTTSTFSMGVDFADVDRDGQVDFFVVDMLSPDHRKRHTQLGERSAFQTPIGVFANRPQSSRNTLQRNRGDGTFAEIAFFAGLEASDWSWGPVFLDVDLDGFEDLLITNGQLRDFQNIDAANRMNSLKAGKRFTQKEITEMIGQFPTLETPNLVFRNHGDWTFQETGAAWGFGTSGISQGIALADLDNDGDLDVIINNLRDAPGIYRNIGDRPRVAVRLTGRAPNRAGIGATIKVTGGARDQTQEMISGGRYLSGDQALRVFAASEAGRGLGIEVSWPGGNRTILKAEPNVLYDIEEKKSAPVTTPTPAPPAPLFREVRTPASQWRVEQPFDDWVRQPLLPKQLSQLGPGLCWHDFDGDGWDDLIIGGGRGGHLTVWRNGQGAGFSLLTNALLNRAVTRDQTAILGLKHALLIGSSNYEDGLTNGGLVRIYDFQGQVAGDSILGSSFSAGPLAFGEVAGNGTLYLFVGGRVVASRYPAPADSLLLKNEAGKLSVVQRWEQLGLVSGAIFADLDQDGFPELLLATEWGPIRLFKLVAGRYEERTAEAGFAKYTGWWNGIASGDFDGDGRMEIVASNWGLNTPFRASRQFPRKVYYGDLDGNGSMDLIESRFDPALGKEVPEQTFDVVRNALPILQTRIASYQAYAQMSVQEIYGESLGRAASLEVNTLESMVFVQSEDRFEARPLPPEAQLAPAFGVAVVDLDGDGAEDLVLAQNFFGLPPGEPRSDAGRGLWLKGDGRGNFVAVPGQESGLHVYGEQRACAWSDYDGDGRPDLAIGQNGNPPKLYHNAGGRPGLRVRLKGPAGNPTGIGSVLRLEGGGKKGYAREVQAGSGYWAQNSPVQVMALPGGLTPEKVVVRFPGGKMVEAAIPAGALEVEVSPDGSLKKVR